MILSESGRTAKQHDVQVVIRHASELPIQVGVSDHGELPTLRKTKDRKQREAKPRRLRYEQTRAPKRRCVADASLPEP
jgi:hypothetical protein